MVLFVFPRMKFVAAKDESYQYNFNIPWVMVL